MKPDRSFPPVAQRLVLIGTTVMAMTVVGLAIQRTTARRAAVEPPVPEPLEVVPDHPIAAEASVFRTLHGKLAFEPDVRRRPDAHPRTFATYRLLRSYPGAPPRVPHGLTATEFRTNRCNTCHERGGFSQRFGAYAPVNPHPEWTACLQCHATNELLVGLPFPEASPDDACRQCHSGGPARFVESGIDWIPAAWPRVRTGEGAVPAIPHELQTRGNCLTCHMGPGSVAEIRTSHPERVNCRQCHLAAASGSDDYVRSPTPPDGGVR